MLEAGQGVVDITPPMGIEMAGFHRRRSGSNGSRVITGIRQPAAVRALVLRVDGVQAAIVSVEVCGVSAEFTRRVQAAAAKLGIPATNIRLCAIHTHSMPSARFFRQWGDLAPEYLSRLETSIIQAIELAQKDLAPAELHVGKHRAEGANFNRTSPVWKADTDFTAASTDDDRWLDTLLHTLRFRRNDPKSDLLWYHISSHPVCYADGYAGPDWPGLVHEKTRARDGLSPVFLQGHCGDVNPGAGRQYIGLPGPSAEAVYTALHQALAHSQPVKTDQLRVAVSHVDVPLDFQLLGEQLAAYRKDPAACTRGVWVDADFSKEWFDAASKWDSAKTTHSVVLSAIRLGDVAFLFHPAELFSYYGLRIRHDSPFQTTLVVGYTDDLVGYLVDPKAFPTGAYEALVAPKIYDLPPYRPNAAAQFTAAALNLLRTLA